MRESVCYIRKVLENGMRIITVPMRDNPTVTVLVLVEVGSKYENRENNGISHFLEHMCFKGTSRRPSAFDITKELDSIGAQYNAFTGQEYTGYYAKSSCMDFDKILDVVSDMYLNPIFPEKEIEKEKGVIIQEINRGQDNPNAVLWYEFDKLLYGDHPAGWKIVGPKENIQRMKRSDFVNYRNRHYVASATTVVVAGRINEDEVFEKVIKAFKDISKWEKSGKEKLIENQKAPQLSIYYKDTDQTQLVLGTRSYNTYSKYNNIISVMRSVLSGGMSSRLFQKLRDEMGICYSVSSHNEKMTDCGVFVVSAGVDSKRVKEAIMAILGELNRMKTELVGQEELNRAKQHLIGGFNLGLETSDSLAFFYGMQEVLKKEIMKPEDIKEIMAVTAEEIRSVAEMIFRDEVLNLSIVGKFSDAEEFRGVLHF